MPPKHPDDYPEPDVLTRAKAIFQADNHSDLDWEMSFRPGDRFRRGIGSLGFFGRRRYVAQAREQLAAEKEGSGRENSDSKNRRQLRSDADAVLAVATGA
jgi:hypothetical protein